MSAVMKDMMEFKMSKTGGIAPSFDQPLYDEQEGRMNSFLIALERLYFKRIRTHLPKCNVSLLDVSKDDSGSERAHPDLDSLEKLDSVVNEEARAYIIKWHYHDKVDCYKGGLLDLKLPFNHYDAVISIHRLNELKPDKQAKAMSRLLRHVEPGKKLIVIYKNPFSIFQKLENFMRKTGMIKSAKAANNQKNSFWAFRKKWWYKFEGSAKVKVLPFRSTSSRLSRALFQGNRLGRWFLTMLFRLESKFPKFWSSHSQEQMIILEKNREYLL